MKAIWIEKAGEPEVMRLAEVATPKPAAGEVLVRVRAAGVNFLETRMRSGNYPEYPLPTPGGIGLEGAGEVAAVGEGVVRLKPGDRVAYTHSVQGSYAEYHAVPADRAARLPDGVDEATAAAAFNKALTACALLTQVCPVKPGDPVVVWAAAGGVGQFVVQWAAHTGARVIGVVGSPAKVAFAKGLGAEHVLVSSQDDVAARVRELTGGKGARAVYDAIGRDAFEASLNALAPRGMYVGYGSASGHPAPFNLMDLTTKGSLYVTRATLADYTREPQEFQALAAEVLDALATGIVKVEAPRTYALADAPQAHRDLASRATTGSLVLIP